MKFWRVRRSSGHVAFLTPYNGDNLGDAAIQEALISNFRKYDPHIQLCGITLHPASTSARHHIPCYPLAVISRPHYHAKKGPVPTGTDGNPPSPVGRTIAKSSLYGRLRLSVRALLFGMGLRRVVRLTQEILHIVGSYILLRKIDMLVVAGGGQLDEEWGGSWGHPYALMKWAVLARAAGSSVVILSVGGCRMNSRLTKLFLRIALSLACYRSYRDHGSRQLALTITRRADGPVVPDLAFSLSPTNHQSAAGSDRKDLHVGVSPISYAHPGLWPTEDRAQYERYIDKLASFVASLLGRRISVTLFSSSSPDEQLFADLRARLDPRFEAEAHMRLSSSNVASVHDLFMLLNSMDFVIASRLHGLILSFLSRKPAVALSYDRKVLTLMTELEQEAYCLDIRSFNNEDLLAAFLSLQVNGPFIASKLSATCCDYDKLLQCQYRLVIQLLARGFCSSRQARTLVASDERPYETRADIGPLG